MSPVDQPDLSEQLPPETHIRMALDYLFVRTRQMRLGVTATLIGAAAEAIKQETRASGEPTSSETDRSEHRVGMGGFAGGSGTA